MDVISGVCRREITAFTDAMTFSNDTLLDSATIEIGANIVGKVDRILKTSSSQEWGFSNEGSLAASK